MLAKVQDFVRADMDSNDVSHGYAHADNVCALALKIGDKMDNVDMTVVSIGALVHDVGDPKYSGSDTAGPEKVAAFLETLEELSPEQRKKIVEIVKNIGFSKSLDPNYEPPEFVEFKIVQDADRLEAMGAIGIARCLMYSATHNIPAFDNDIFPRDSVSKEEYRELSQNGKGKTTAVCHFFEKLFKLRDKINTKPGQKMADKRHKFMTDYIRQLLMEEMASPRWFELLVQFE